MYKDIETAFILERKYERPLLAESMILKET